MAKVANASIVFDAEAVSRAVRHDRYFRRLITNAWENRFPIVISAATLVEVTYPRIDRAALRWVRSRLEIMPLSEHVADDASQLLRDANLHGHRHAIDAMVCATALRLGDDVAIYTSDPTDLVRLVGDRAAIVPIR